MFWWWGSEPVKVAEGLQLARHPSYIRGGCQLSSIDPFNNATPRLSLLQKLQILCFGLPLLAFRLYVFVLTMFYMRFFAWLSLLGLPPDAGIDEPLPRWRQFLFRTPMLRLLRIIVWCFGFLWIRTNGRPASKKEAPIIVSNHVSFIEPFYLIFATLASPVQRQEDAGAPFVGPLFRAAMSIFVDRRTPSSRRKTIEAIAARATDDRFPQVLVFPEGTTTNGSAIISLKLGAFTAGVPVQPVVVKYSHAFGIDPSCVAGGPKMMQIALRLLSQPLAWVEVTWLPVHRPTPQEQKDPAAFAAAVQADMAAAAGAAVTRHTYEDVALGMAARQAHRPPSSGVVEWRAITETLDVSPAEAQALLAAFTEADEDGDGQLSFVEFAAALRNASARQQNNRQHSANANGLARTQSLSSRGRSVSSGSGREAVPALGFASASGFTASAGVSEEWPLPAAEVRRAFEALDSDRRGNLSFRDYLVGAAVCNARGPQGEEGARKLLVDIVGAGAKSGGLTASGLDEIFSHVSGGGGGGGGGGGDDQRLIDREEFLRIAEEHPELLAYYAALWRSDLLSADARRSRSGSNNNHDSKNRNGASVGCEDQGSVQQKLSSATQG